MNTELRCKLNMKIKGVKETFPMQNLILNHLSTDKLAPQLLIMKFLCGSFLKGIWTSAFLHTQLHSKRTLQSLRQMTNKTHWVSIREIVSLTGKWINCFCINGKILPKKFFHSKVKLLKMPGKKLIHGQIWKCALNILLMSFVLC